MTKVKTSNEQIPFLEESSIVNDPSNAILVILEIQAKSMLQDPFVNQLIQVTPLHLITY
jgi:hypothetical protein